MVARNAAVDQAPGRCAADTCTGPVIRRASVAVGIEETVRTGAAGARKGEARREDDLQVILRGDPPPGGAGIVDGLFRVGPEAGRELFLAQPAFVIPRAENRGGVGDRIGEGRTGGETLLGEGVVLGGSERKLGSPAIGAAARERILAPPLVFEADLIDV